MLTECNFIAKGDTEGAFYAHAFKSLADGSIIQVECSMEEYKALAVKDAPPVKPPDGYVWDHSFSGNRYDTPSGRLEEDHYADEGEQYVVLRDGMLWGFRKDVLADLTAALEAKK